MSKARPKPVAKIRWTRAEKVNAVVWATEWGLTVFTVSSAFAGIVATRTLPLYVFLPTTLLGITLAALSFGLRGKLRAIFDTQRRAEQETTGRFRIEEIYGRPQHFAPLAPKARHALLTSVENDSTQQFIPITEEYSHS